MGRLTRNKAEDCKRKPLFVLSIVLLLSSACAENEIHIPAQPCSDFQKASFLQSSKLKFQFLLFTSSNSNCGQLISADDIRNSNFNTSLDTKIIIHGFRLLGRKPSWISKLINAFFHAATVNVIAVDWVYGARGDYFGAVDNITKLSYAIFNLISKLLAHGVSDKSIHLIGVSLGAHIAGLVGHLCESRLGRITGLDPAGPTYTSAGYEKRLDPGDAVFVEAIHTDTDNFGIRIPVGHIDYYINGGKDQPGCQRFISLGYNYLICDHMRAIHLYVSALENSCPLMAFPCSSHEDFLAGQCLDCMDPFLLSCPRIGLLERSGVSMEKLPKEVKVYLMTTPSAPYCMYHSLVEFRLQEKRSVATSLKITFRSSNSTASVKITIPKQQLLGKGVLAHQVPLCQIEAVILKHLPKRQLWKKEEALIMGKFCTTALPVSNREEMFCLSQYLPLMNDRPLEHDLAVVCAK